MRKLLSFLNFCAGKYSLIALPVKIYFSDPESFLDQTSKPPNAW